MYLHPSLGRDLNESQCLLEACAHIAEAASLIELERRLNYWLTRLYDPQGWTLSCAVDGSDKPLFELQHGVCSAPTIATNAVPIVMPLSIGANMVGRFELVPDTSRNNIVQALDELPQLVDVLSAKLGQICLQLQCLSQTAELLFMRGLISGESAAGVDRALDQRSATLLDQRDVSSIQVMIDRLNPGGLHWSIASRRADLALPSEQRQRLLQLVADVRSDYTTRSDVQLRALSDAYDLPRLTQLQSVLVVPIRHATSLLSVVIVSEEWHWSRQPIAPQVASVCVLLARAVATSVTRNRLIEEVIVRERSMPALIDELDDAVIMTKQGMISISDRGIGIPRAAQERIFESFYRADNARSLRASGVGLGLSIVKLLVETHQGHVTVRSVLGRGSVFSVSRPIAAPPTDNVDRSSSSRLHLHHTTTGVS